MTSRAHMQKGEDSRRLGKQHHRRRPQAGPKWDLAAIRTIYSPEARSHASILSPSAVEEQRREGHHLREEKVELVV
jgi:hypothetical protein